jgi:hypothetical protein
MSVTETRAVIPGRVLPAGQGMAWIGEGWRLFLRAPLMWVLSILILFVIFIVLGFIPILGQIAAFFLKPILFAGYMVACHSLAVGGEFELEHLFAGFRERVGSLLILALILFVAFAAIFAVTLGFIAVTVGVSMLTKGTEDMAMALAASAVYIIAALLIMLALMIPLLMAYWFAPALIVLNGIAPWEAMKASFGASLRNFVPFLVYGIVMTLLAIVAVIPFGLGLLVWVPVALASTYAAYRDMFLEPAQAAPQAPATLA